MSILEETAVQELARRVAELEEALADMTREVRTRRLVVVDEAGEERIHTTVTDSGAQLDIDAPARPGLDLAPAAANVTLSASYGEMGDDLGVKAGGAWVGAYINEEEVAVLDVHDDLRDLHRGPVGTVRGTAIDVP